MKKTASIRGYLPKDYDKLREVCYLTATGIYREEKNKEITPAIFFEHYAEYYPQYCFTVADNNDEAVGYIICAPDYKKFYKDFKNKLKKIRKLSRIEALKFKIAYWYVAHTIGRKYPAHLHINLLPEFQRLGLGHKMVERLILKLKEDNISKLQLGCSASNEKGCNFYKKFGFHVIKAGKSVIDFGIDVTKYQPKQ